MITMPFDLRYAGLDPAMEQRLRLAANALAAHRVQARATQWDGTRCDVVAADPGDEYGRRVLDIARRRGTPTLEIGTSPRTAETGTTVARLTRALHDLLRGSDRGASASTDATEFAVDASGLVKLAGDDALAGKDVEARFQNIVVWLLPDSGRVLSATVSDQLRAREQLATRADWTFSPLAAGRQRGIPPGEVSTSLDAFLVHAAWQARAHLPAFPSRDVALRDWPDLGAAAALVEPLAIVQALQRGPTTVTQIARRRGIAEADVGACLWAFKAAGLLHDRAAAVPTTADPKQSSGGLFSRLAAHFGLFKA
jgi:hypothetical protein